MKAKDYFDKIASYYDKWYLTPIGRYVDETEKDQVFSLWQTKKGLVLDLGCGTGNYTVELIKRQIKVVGLDASFSMLLLARKKLSSACLVQADALVLPFKDNIFEGVLSITLFEFLSSPEEVLKEVYRVLKPRGEVVIGTMNTFSLWFFFKRLKTLFTETAYRYARFYTINQLKKLLKQAGFKNIKTSGVIYLPAFIPPILIPLAQRLDRKWANTGFKHFAAFVLIRGERP
jgi:ubiquinone/menaquinone biosynthesis C-methylase UbiE